MERPPHRRTLTHRLPGLMLAAGLVGLCALPARAQGPAAAAPAPDKLSALIAQGEAQRQEIAALEGRLATARTAQAGREARAAQAAAEIERLKSQPPGVGRDLALGDKLAQAQAQAGELAESAQALRRLGDELGQARRRLLATCDRILDADPGGRLPAASRLAWLRLRTAQVDALLGDGNAAAARALAQSEMAAPAERPAEADDPQLLRERADLLRDSADKLRREIQRLSARSEELQRRQRMRERASQVDEDLFAEQSTARGGSARAGGSSRPGATLADTAAVPTVSGPPAAPTSGGGSLTAGPLRTGPDPSTLDALLRVEGPGDPATKLSALARAQAELSALAGDLQQRATRLEKRAAELGRKK